MLDWVQMLCSSISHPLFFQNNRILLSPETLMRLYGADRDRLTIFFLQFSNPQSYENKKISKFIKKSDLTWTHLVVKFNLKWRETPSSLYLSQLISIYFSSEIEMYLIMHYSLKSLCVLFNHWQVKKLPSNAGDTGDSGSIPELGRSPGGGDGNTLHYFLAKKIPWTEEPGGLESMGSQKNQPWLSNWACTYAWYTTCIWILRVYESYYCPKPENVWILKYIYFQNSWRGTVNLIRFIYSCIFLFYLISRQPFNSERTCHHVSQWELGLHLHHEFWSHLVLQPRLPWYLVTDV